MFKTYSSSSSLVITSRWFATSRLRAPVSVRLVYYDVTVMERQIVRCYTSDLQPWDSVIITAADTLGFYVYRCHPIGIGLPSVDTRRSYDRRIPAMGFTLYCKVASFIESGPWWQSAQRHLTGCPKWHQSYWWLSAKMLQLHCERTGVLP